MISEILYFCKTEMRNKSKMELYQLAIECKNYSDANIECTVVRNGSFSCHVVSGASKKYEDMLLSLCDLLGKKCSQIAENLREHVVEYDKNRFFHQSSIDAIINCVISYESLFLSSQNKDHNDKKIFISHSSKDVKVVKEFVDKILLLGIGLKEEDVFCTSIEGLNIKNGEDIREHIKKNILTSDYSLLMISDNYKQSEICLNEMGAVWAGNNKVLYFLLPNTDFDKIGWLCNTKQAERIDSQISLDGIRDELMGKYNLEKKQSWSRYRQDYVDALLHLDVMNLNDEVKEHLENSLGNASDKILALLREKNKSLTIYEISTMLGMSRLSVERQLNELEKAKKVAVEGAFKHTLRWKSIV